MQSPPNWFLEAVAEFTARVYENAMAKRPIASVVVAPDLGVQLGITPGEWFDVMTAAGYVRIESPKK